MKKRDFTKLKAFLKGNGFYLILMVCVMAIGVTAWTALKPQLSPMLDNESEQSTSTVSLDNEIQTVQQPQSDVPIESSKEEKKQESKQTKETAANKNQSSKTQSKKEKYMFPCGNKILMEYSDGQPVFSQTMQDWRAHNGVDFAASKGTPVTAIADGVVKDVREDMMLGWVVEIEHTNKYTALYCGLQKNIAAKKGQKISAGAVVGGVGDIPCESSQEEHLHFEMYKGDKSVDPMQILGKKIEQPALGNGEVK